MNMNNNLNSKFLTFKISKQIPDNMEIVNVEHEINNNQVYIKVEVKEYIMPKDGDILFYDYAGMHGVFIYKKTNNKRLGGSYAGYIKRKNYETQWEMKEQYQWVYLNHCRYATEEEKCDFFNNIETLYNKVWNPDLKKFKKGKQPNKSFFKKLFNKFL